MVRGLMLRWRADSLLVSPAIIPIRTSHSRPVSRWLQTRSGLIPHIFPFLRSADALTAIKLSTLSAPGAKNCNISAAGRGGLSRYCLLYTSDAADEEDSVELGGRRII